MLHFKDYALTQCANKDRDSQKDSQIFQHKNFIGNFAKRVFTTLETAPGTIEKMNYSDSYCRALGRTIGDWYHHYGTLKSFFNKHLVMCVAQF